VIFLKTYKLLKIKKIQTTAFHPELNGSLERSHRVLAEYLRHYLREDQTNWDEWILYTVYVYNTMVYTTTAYTTFELVYGSRSEVLSALRETPSVQYNYENYLTELRGRLQSEHEVARQKLISSKEKSKEYYDKSPQTFEIQIGQKVLLFDETARRRRSKKLSPQYIGPYEVLAVDGVNVTIRKGHTTKRCMLIE